MQVKKFEARTMKEALNMIKSQLGPEAIILSAKDIGGGFGIAGRNSVEVTAAVSELTLKKKQLAEKKLNEMNRRRFSEIPATKQKEFIDKVFTRISQAHERAPITSTRYIDIDDEETDRASIEEASKQRIKSAAAEAFKAASFINDGEKPKKQFFERSEKKSNFDEEQLKLRAMQAEISYLKRVISEFQKVPQSFVTMHPGAAEGIPFELSSIFTKLKKKGIDKDLIVKILKTAQKSLSPDQLKRSAYVNAWVAKYILDTVYVVSEKSSSEKKYHAFIGPSGHGKTACLVKMASYFAICKKKNVAIATCDQHKVGSMEQLKIYARILNVPFIIIKKQNDWEKIEQALPGIDHVLVDFPGLSLKSEMEVEYLSSLLPKVSDREVAIHYVQSATAKNIDAVETLKRYQAVHPTDLIVTGVDISAQHGIILNLQNKFNLPLHSFGIGANIPEDFEMATKERVVDLLFKLTKLQGKRS